MSKKFVKGMYVKERAFNWGSIVQISIKVDDFVQFLNENKNDKGYVNIDIKDSKKGSKYAVLNEFKKSKNDLPF